jgi:hypothetical protein
MAKNKNKGAPCCVASYYFFSLRSKYSAQVPFLRHYQFTVSKDGHLLTIVYNKILIYIWTLSSIPVLPDYSTYNILHKGSVAFIW